MEGLIDKLVSEPLYLLAGLALVVFLVIAVFKKLPLLMVLMTDSRFGSIATQAIRFELTKKPITIDQPSWAATIETLGFTVERVFDEKQMDESIAAWDPAAGPHFVEVSFDPDIYERMTDRIR